MTWWKNDDDFVVMKLFPSFFSVLKLLLSCVRGDGKMKNGMLANGAIMSSF